MSVDMAERPPKFRFVVYVRLEKDEIVEGKFPILGPPYKVRLDMIPIQFVPPFPSVTRVRPVLSGFSVIGSNAYTVLRMVVFDDIYPG
jgi:hypothetical protein